MHSEGADRTLRRQGKVTRTRQVEAAAADKLEDEFNAYFSCGSGFNRLPRIDFGGVIKKPTGQLRAGNDGNAVTHDDDDEGEEEEESGEEEESEEDPAEEARKSAKAAIVKLDNGVLEVLQDVNRTKGKERLKATV